jgi:hypothetical protein
VEIGYTLLGFDDHQLIEYTEDHFKFVSQGCPALETAKKLDLKDHCCRAIIK